MAPLESVEDIQVDYDSVGDVLHITLVDVDEPTYGHNVDDIVVVLRSTVSDLMVGLEILDAKRHGPEKIGQVLMPVIRQEKRRIKDKLGEMQSRLDELERRKGELIPV